MHAAGQWRAPRELDARRRPRASSRPTAAAVVSFASNDYLGPHPAPRGASRAAHDAIDRWGTGSGAARLIVGLAAGARRARGRAGGRGSGTERRGPLHHRVRRQPRRAHHVRRARRARVLRRAQPRVAHRRPPARAARRSRCTATATPRTSTSCCARPSAARAIVVTETVFSMDGDVAPVDELARGVRAPRRAARARRGARGARARRSTTPRSPTSTCLRVGTLSKTLGALGGFVAGPAALHRAAREPRPLLHLHHRVDARPTPPPRSPRCGVVRSPEGDELRARLRANIERLRPGHPSPIVPFVCGSEARALAAAAALLDHGLLVTAIRPPTVPPGTSRLRVTRVGRAHARAGRHARRRARRALPRTRDEPVPRTLVFVTGTATEVGKTWWTARGGAGAARRRRRRSRRASRCSRATARRGRPTPRCSRRPPARTPTTVCPPHRTYPPGVGTADGRRRARADPRSRSPTSPARSRGPTARRRRPGRRGRRPALADQRPTATTSTSRACSRPTSWCSSPTPGSAPSTRCGCRCRVRGVRDLVVALNRFGADPLHERNRAHLAADGLRRGHDARVTRRPAPCPTAPCSRAGRADAGESRGESVLHRRVVGHRHRGAEHARAAPKSSFSMLCATW